MRGDGSSRPDAGDPGALDRAPAMVTEPVRCRFDGIGGVALVGDRLGPEGAPTVLLSHGGGQTRHSWSGAARCLAEQGYRVLSLDARGHGESDWAPDGDYSLDALGGDLAAVAATLSGPLALVGASMGGMSSFYAIGEGLMPRAEALVLVDIVMRPAAAGVAKIMRFMNARPEGFASLEEVADAIASYNPHRPRPRNPEGLLKNLRRRPDGRFHWHWDPRMIAPREGGAESWSRALARAAAGVRLPVALVHGGDSDIVDDDGIAELRALVPQAETVSVAGAGHMVAGDRNDAFNEAVIAFLARHFPVRR